MWQEVETDDEINDEAELASENDFTEERDTDSESEQDCVEEDHESVALSRKVPRVPTFIGKDGTSRWKKQCTNKSIRTRKENIIVRLPGVRSYGKDAKSVLDCWSLYFTDNMLEIIVERTNLYISKLAGKYTSIKEIKPGTRKRCHFCTKDSKKKYYYKKCNKFIFLIHLQAWCPTCSSTAENL